MKWMYFTVLVRLAEDLARKLKEINSAALNADREMQGLSLSYDQVKRLEEEEIGNEEGDPLY